MHFEQKKKKCFSVKKTVFTLQIFPSTEKFPYLNDVANRKEKVMKSWRTHGLFHRTGWTLKVNKMKNETEFTHYEVFKSPSTKSPRNLKIK